MPPEFKLITLILMCLCGKIVLANEQMDRILRFLKQDYDRPGDYCFDNEFVLVVGEKGVGKTTFSEWMSEVHLFNYFDELESNWLDSPQNIIMYNNEEKEYSVFPKLYKGRFKGWNKARHVYCDVPGYHGPNYELGIAYLINEIIHDPRVKVVFLVDFNSIKTGGDRDKFIGAFKRFSKFIKNVERLENSTSIIVTKVPENINGKVLLDGEIIEAIKTELISIKTELEENPQSETAHQIRIIDILSDKIGIFQPNTNSDWSRREALEDLLRLKTSYINIKLNDFEYVTSDNAKKFMIELLDTINAEFTADVSKLCDKIKIQHIDQLNIATADTISELNDDVLKSSDMLKKLANIEVESFLREMLEIVTTLNIDVRIDYFNKYFHHMEFLSKLLNVSLSIPVQTIEHIERVADVIVNDVETLTKQLQTNDFPQFQIDIDIGNVFNEIEEFYLQIEKNTIDLDVVLKKFNRGMKVLKKLETDEASVLLKELIDAINELEIGISLTILEQITGHIDRMTNLSNTKNQTTLIRPTHIRRFNKILADIQSSLEWYHFLNKLLHSIPSESISKDAAVEVRATCDRVESVDKLGLQQLVTAQNNELFRIEHVQLNSFKLDALKRVLNILIEGIQISCPEKETMLVKGVSLKLSQVMRHSCWSKATTIQIFALKSIVIDTDIDKTGKAAQLTIISPIWHIYGDRKILLNGLDGFGETQDAASGKKISERGSNGKSGESGGAGGYFFGIGQTFINGNQLKIEANGGRGGNGQHGGTGGIGLDGLDPTIPDCSPYWWKRACVSDAWDGKFEYENQTPFGIYNLFYQVKGTKGTWPGEGGNGGSAGAGGLAGNVQLVELNGASGVSVSAVEGKPGTVGRGGSAGESTSDGKTIVFSTVDAVLSETAGQAYISSNGIDGITGNCSSRLIARKLNRLSLSLNNYKNFCRQQLNDTNLENHETQVRQFLAKLLENKEINAVYDIHGLVDEFNELNRQPLLLQPKFSLTPLLESLLDRIVDVSKKAKNDAEEEMVLSHLLATTLSRLYVERAKPTTKSYANIATWIERLIKFDLERAMEDSSQEIINKNQKNYRSYMERPHDIGYDFFLADFKSNVQNISEAIDGDIDNLINEIKGEPLNLDQKKKQLKKKLAMRSMLNPLKMAGTISDFYSYRIKTIEYAGLWLYGVNKSIAALNVQLINRFEIFKAQVTKINTTINEYERNVDILADYSLKPIRNEIIECQQLMNQIDANPYDDWESIVVKHKQRLIDLLVELKTENMTKNLDQNIRSIDHLIAVIHSLEAGIDVFDKYENDEAAIKLIGELMQMQEERIDVHSVYEAAITYIPTIKKDLDSFEVSRSYIENKVIHTFWEDEDKYKEDKAKAGDPIAERLIRKWKLQSFFHDIRSAYLKLSKQIPIEELNLQLCFTKIIERILALSSICNDIAAYFESKQLADSIGKIITIESIEMETIDNELFDFVNRTQKIIKSNLLWSRWREIFYNGVFNEHFYDTRRHSFPMVPMIYNELDKSMQTMDSAMPVKDQIIRQSKLLNQTFYNIESLSSAYADDLRTNVTFDGSPNHPAFYTWRYDDFKDEITKLLKGEDIILYADIAKALDRSAVKANQMFVYFKLHNNTLQEKFNRHFGYRIVRNSMIGPSSYYRCGNRIYSIPIDERGFVYNFKRSDNDVRNRILGYANVKIVEKAAPFLSPYGMWEIALEKPDPKFANEPMDLELIGVGSYLAHGEFTKNLCNDQLDNYYSFHKIISAPDE